VSLFGALMSHQAFYVASRSGNTSRGDATYGTPVLAYCRWEPLVRLVVDRDGRQRSTSGNLYTEYAVRETDAVWPPGADQTQLGQSRQPISVKPETDLLTGATLYYKVVLG
jgi:hypothetical protein